MTALGSVDIQLPDSSPVSGWHAGQRARQPEEGFADWATARDNPYFAKAIINRTWFHFLGRGFVNPIDDLHEDNEASHQGLLDTLRTQFVDHEYDVKYLMSAICNSQTYQRASIPHAGNEKDEELFSHMAIKVMTGNQLFDSLVGSLVAK